MNEENLHKRLDAIFDTIDDLCLAGKFDEVDNVLKNVDIQNEPTTLLIGYLTITLMAHKGNKLNCRTLFYDKVEEELRRRGETEKRIKNLLVGLK